jgi:thiol-disulfide isomerase/thioredoxin
LRRSPRLALLLLLAAAPAWSATADPVQRALETPRLAAPFHLRTLDGRRLDLATLTAHGPVVLDFWATWCKPCVASMPELSALARRYAARGVSVLGISIDGPRNFARVRPFVNKLGLSYANAIDEDGALQERFQIAAVPTTLVIGSDRRVMRVITGYQGGPLREVEDALNALLPPDSTRAAPDTSVAR